MAIHFNSNGSLKIPSKTSFYISVGYLASNERQTKIDVELPRKSASNFEKQYQEITGVLPIPDNINYYILDHTANKWGVEMRIYFNSNKNIPSYLARLVVDSRPSSGYNSRINNNKLVWKLIRHGFRLSNKQDMKLISSKIPKAYWEDFQYGLSL